MVDLRRGGGLTDDDWWLNIYVMLSRARRLENILLLGTQDRELGMLSTDGSRHGAEPDVDCTLNG